MRRGQAKVPRGMNFYRGLLGLAAGNGGMCVYVSAKLVT